LCVFSTPADRPLRATGPPAKRQLIRKRKIGGVADVGRRAPVHAPLHTDSSSEVARRRDDARFDLDLRLRPIERVDQLRGSHEIRRQVSNDDRVGALIRENVAAPGQRRARE
jgi:hypothetical protein